MSLKLKCVILDASKESITATTRELPTEHFDIVASLTDGKDCIEYLSNNKVDLLILDIVLSGVDGFAVMEWVRNNLQSKPKVFVVSNLSQDNFISKAVSLGADYYFIKPVAGSLFKERLFEMMNIPTEKKIVRVEKNEQGIYNFESNIRVNKEIDEKISNIFVSVGIPAHIKGYKYLRNAIKLVVSNPSMINAITKELYPTIAQDFTTSSSKVERAIRHAIDVAWSRGKMENINKFFGFKVYGTNDKPTNGEFIALVADKLLIEGYSVFVNKDRKTN